MSDDVTEVRISERDLLIGALTEHMQQIKTAIYHVRQLLIQLDEIGEPVARCKTRGAKLAESYTELDAHINYDLIQRMGKQTKEQKVRAERHELS